MPAYTSQSEVSRVFLAGRNPNSVFDLMPVPEEEIKKSLEHYCKVQTTEKGRNKARALYMYYVNNSTIGHISERLHVVYDYARQLIREGRQEIYPFIPPEYR
jgi:hypothetical protein